jgi:uncharacterized membrane protein
MVIKRKKKTSGLWFNYKRLLLTFFLSIVLYSICTPSSTSANYVYADLDPGVSWHIWANGINDKGVVVGSVIFWGFVYSEGTYTELLPPGWVEVYPTGINGKGIVVGYGYDGTEGIVKGFVYSEGTYTELVPPGWVEVYPTGINGKGIVVGYGYDGTSGYFSAFMATPSPKK